MPDVAGSIAMFVRLRKMEFQKVILPHFTPFSLTASHVCSVLNLTAESSFNAIVLFWLPRP